MWFLLSAGLRRWLLYKLAVPLGARAARRLARAVDAHDGPAALSRGLVRVADTATRTTGAGRPRRRGLLRRLLGRR